MRFGLEEHIVDSLISVFEEHSKVDKAIVFGSRAKGNYRTDSDIDIAIKGQELTTDDVIMMSVAFEAEGITYKIDLIDYNNIKEFELKAHIDRVGIELYSRWKEIQLREISTDISYGYTESATLEAIGPKFLRITDITSGKINWDTVPYCKITDKDFEKYKLGLGDIVIARTGATTGYNAIIKNNINAVYASYLIRFQINREKASPFFVGYVLKSNAFQDYVDAIAGGSAQPGANAQQLADFKFLLPPLSEQTIIASILSSLDDKIDLLHRQNKTLEQLAQTLFRQWFVEEAEESWVDSRLEEHTEVFRGLSYKGNGLTDVNLGIPMHNLNSVNEGGGYKYEGIKFYNGEYRDRHLVNVGDIIVTNTEQGHEYKLIGFPAIVPDYYGEKGVFSQHIYKLNLLRKSYLTREFVYYLLMTSSVREQVIAATNGSTVNMLAIDGLQRPIFKLPPQEKVKEFTSIVKDYWIKMNVNHNQIRTLTKTRDALLPKLIGGEVRIIDN
ncbi:MAG: restriction endonuclease subunit S [Cyclobacteriaceae bacterium]|jgi:type I restriction enzyme S subunit|nr:restriction endonuclease subunit S [Cytophagales bacterium]MCZ8328044.1 restriction endonuclease subunit S [Cyclobacteriaceae bacterium]